MRSIIDYHWSCPGGISGEKEYTSIPEDTELGKAVLFCQAVLFKAEFKFWKDILLNFLHMLRKESFLQSSRTSPVKNVSNYQRTINAGLSLKH